MNKYSKIAAFTAAAASATAAAYAGTSDKFRLCWTDDPATTMTIGWDQSSGDGTVYYSTTDYGSDKAAWEANGIAHPKDRQKTKRGMENEFARLTGLSADTAYYFVVISGSDMSDRMFFKTAHDTPASFRFAAGGDSRNNRTPRRNANRVVARTRPLFIWFGGDYTDDHTTTEWQNWMDDWQHTISSDGRAYPIIPALGNHDDDDVGSESDGREVLNDLFDIDSTTNAKFYYAHTIGGTQSRFYTLNSQEAKDSGGSDEDLRHEQRDWMEDDVDANPVMWRHAIHHHPLVPHQGGKSEKPNLIKDWAPVYYDKQFQLCFDSDSHMMKRTWPMVPTGSTGSSSSFNRASANEFGTVFIGEGCWGAPTRDNDDNKSFTRSSGRFNGMQLVDVYSAADKGEDKIEVRTIYTDNIASAGSNSESDDVFKLPSGLEVWNPSHGSSSGVHDDNQYDPDDAPTVVTVWPNGTSPDNGSNGGGTTGGGSTGGTGGGTSVILEEGVNGYTGTADTYIREGSPDTSYGSSTAVELDINVQRYGLIKFENIENYVPAGVTITSAKMVLRGGNSGSGFTAHKMLQSWGGSSTWNSLSGGISFDDVEAGSASVGSVSSLTLNQSSDLVIDVAVAQDWLDNPSNNHGLVLNPTGDDLSSFRSLNTTTSYKPELHLEWSLGTSATFEQGSNGYTGTVDTYIREGSPDTSYATSTAVELDTDVKRFGLIRFEDIENTIPAGATVTSAKLVLRGGNSGAGFNAHVMLESWDDTDTWNSIGGAISFDDVQAGSAVVASLASLTLNQSSDVNLDAAVVQDWIDNPQWNFGLVLDPNGTDLSSFRSSNTTTSYKPELHVTYTTE